MSEHGRRNDPTTPTSPETGPPIAGSGLPPELALYQLAVGHYLSRALAVAVSLDLADHIGDRPRSAQELAAASQSHAPSLLRLLRLLASTGVLVESAPEAFELSPLGQLLRADTPRSMKDAVALFAGKPIQDGWRELDFCVRTGLPAFKQNHPDGDAFDSLRANPEFEASFDRAMAAFTSQAALAVSAAYDFGPFGHVIDVGGGNGALLLGILRSAPDLRGTVFDQPTVVERAKEAARAAGMDDRLDAIGGSFFDEIPKGADAYLIKHVIHDWNDEDAVRILMRCRDAMQSDAKLLVIEGIYPEKIDTSPISRGATANDVNMLVSTGGRQRSEREFQELFARSGFELSRIVPTASPICVIEATPR